MDTASQVVIVTLLLHLSTCSHHLVLLPHLRMPCAPHPRVSVPHRGHLCLLPSHSVSPPLSLSSFESLITLPLFLSYFFSTFSLVDLQTFICSIV